MVFCFGELLLRMSPSLNRQWIYHNMMPVYVGGAELNVATALAKWEVPVKYCTALPDNYLVKEIIEDINEKGIDTSAVYFSGNRIGTYYLPQGADMKNAGVIYDRAYSSFAELSPGLIDWEKVLEGCTWFHFSAISPALNKNVAAVCREALYYASQKGITISVDLNYRSQLWQYGLKPTQVMPELVNYCSVIMGNIWAVENLLGVSSTIENSVGRSQQELLDAAADSMLQLHRQYKQATSFAYTFRLENNYWAVLQHGKEKAVSKQFTIGEVLDGVGSGDCFMAGLIYGLHNQHSAQETIDLAATAAVGKLLEQGDATNQNL
jgi:2-dehydro-3-deoxygluconokinase